MIARERRRGLLHPAIALAAAAVSIAEHRRPAAAKNSAAAVSNDLCWWALQALGSAAGVVALGSRRLRTTIAAAAAPRALARLPIGARLIGTVLIVDFARWGAHVMRHRIGFLWRFHKTHHETTHLNQFSAYRLHPVDHVMAVALGALPLRLSGASLGDVPTLQLIVGMLGRTHHANIDTTFGPLDRILISPAAHRVHHSPDPEHIDVNFGVTFSIWDQLFGTYVQPPATPQPTGLPSSTTPPDANEVIDVPAKFMRQVLRPLVS